MSTDCNLPQPAPKWASSLLMPMAKKLQLWKQFSADERGALLALPFQIEEISPSDFIVRNGHKANHSCLLLSGFAFRQRVTHSGGRSICAVHMQGDVIDLQNSVLGIADHSVQALGGAKVARIPRKAILDLAFAYPNIGMAMWYDTLVDGSMFREWMLNIARRDAQTRIAHLLCEFGLRLESLGLGERTNYEFPMTQEQLADATGLTPVHVNRSLRELEERGLVTRTARTVVVADWVSLKQAGEFDEAYLHLEGMDKRASSWPE